MCFGDCTVGFEHLGLLDCDFSLYRIQPPEIANITIHITALNILVNISGEAIPQALLSQACVLPYTMAQSQACLASVPGTILLCSLSLALPSAVLDLLSCSAVKACLP